MSLAPTSDWAGFFFFLRVTLCVTFLGVFFFLEWLLFWGLFGCFLTSFNGCLVDFFDVWWFWRSSYGLCLRLSKENDWGYLCAPPFWQVLAAKAPSPRSLRLPPSTLDAPPGMIGLYHCFFALMDSIVRFKRVKCQSIYNNINNIYMFLEGFGRTSTGLTRFFSLFSFLWFCWVFKVFYNGSGFYSGFSPFAM